MRNKIREQAQYRLALATHAWKHKDAFYDAIIIQGPGTVAGQLALFLLEEAVWPVENFLSQYERGVLDD